MRYKTAPARLILVLLVWALAAAGLHARPEGARPDGAQPDDALLLEAPSDAAQAMAAYETAPTYTAYLAAREALPRPGAEYVISAVEYSRADMALQVVAELGGRGPVLVTAEEGFVEWEVDVAEAGLYSIEIEYYPVPGRGTAIERELRINGERPFQGAETLVFSRVWTDEGPFLKDTRGNEIRPRQIERPMWQSVPLRDSVGYVDEPYLFHLDAGRNTLRLVSVSEPMAIASIKIGPIQAPPPYESVRREYESKGHTPVDDVVIKVQGESAALRSTSSLFAVADPGDPTVEPYHPAESRLNSIGGHRWQLVGEWIEWRFSVPLDGLYQIAIKGKQDQQRGLYSNRRILIDGEVPFKELEAVRFNFSDTYRMRVLGDEEQGEPYLFYLTAGEHTLRMEVTLGDLADLLRRVEASLYELNTVYRNIIMITSASPDPLRSYQLETRIPGLIDRLNEQSAVITDIADDLEALTGQRGGQTAVLRDVARLLRRMADKPWIIPNLLGEYRDGIGSLGTWIMSARNQPLQIDYILISTPGADLPAATPTWGQTLMHELRAFLASFTHDYTSIGEIVTEETQGGPSQPSHLEPLKVWIGMGRDQAQTLKQMIDDTFTPETGIRVDLQLVNNMGELLVPATIANRAPDVALGAANMDLAFRGAVADLTQFEDFNEVAARFHKSALLPFRFRDAVYALPETQSFPMLFYRKDVLAELGLDVPQTWDDVYRLIPALQRRNLEFGLAPNMGTFTMFLYQKGVSLYKEDSIMTNLDSEAAVATFQEMTDLYSLYSLPLTYDFINRFRMGEMPLAISNYGDFNTLTVFAPELRGQWGMAPVPGIRQPDGTINRTVSVSESTLLGTTIPTGTTGSIIMEKSRRKAEAWEFLKWWTRTDTQVRFGLEMESLMGAAARWPTANVEAFQQLPWRVEDRAQLNEQWRWVEGIPPVLGGYYVTRQFDWLFRAVVLDNQPLRESIIDYNREANKEIARKRDEFGFETDYAKLDAESKALFWDHYTHVHRLDW